MSPVARAPVPASLGTSARVVTPDSSVNNGSIELAVQVHRNCNNTLVLIAASTKPVGSRNMISRGPVHNIHYIPDYYSSHASVMIGEFGDRARGALDGSFAVVPGPDNLNRSARSANGSSSSISP